MKQSIATQILEQTRDNYNKVATDFSISRHALWPDLDPLFEYITSGDKSSTFQKKARDKILDLGCGNGRLYEVFKKKGADYIGVDNSQELIKLAKAKYPQAQFIINDGLNLSFGDNSFDKVYSIAVLHHVPSKELRQQFLREAKRVLKPNGLLVITTWKLAPIQRFKLNFWFFLKKILLINKMDFGDVLVPWGNTNWHRYVHNFTEKSLKKALRQAGFQIKTVDTIERVGFKNTNIFAVAKKT